MGTPHRGSEKASYGKVLAKIATIVMNKPSSRLVPALKRNSDELMRLTSDFKFQLSNYQVVSFYEMKPMKFSSTLIVRKESALWEVNGEDQTPVDENRSNMCKFETRDDPTYEQLWITVHRMIKAKNVGYWAIFWIDASSNETAEQGFLSIAKVCGVEENFKAVKRWLSNLEDSWLLIIDNADNPSQDVSQYFPTGNRGAVIITTRNPGCEIHATVGSYDFGRMELEDAITLLLRAAGREDVSDEAPRRMAKPAVKILGCLALAIIQAGAVIRRKLYSMEDYCTVYSRRRKQLLSDGPIQGINDYRYTVYTTWEISIGVIENMSNKTADDAIELLQFFSMLHFDNVSEDVLKEAWDNRNRDPVPDYIRINQLCILRNRAADVEDDVGNIADVSDFNEEEEREKAVQEDDEKEQSSDTSGNWNPYLTRKATTLLSSFSLISVSGSSNRISMHPLVHAWARDRLSEAEQKRCWRIAASTLALSISYNECSFDYSFRRFLLPHVRSCLDARSSELFTNKNLELELTEVALRFAFVYRENGQSREAVELGEKHLEIRERILGVEHPDTLLSMYNLARSYDDMIEDGFECVKASQPRLLGSTLK
ncbi:hypothetical protein MMC14_005718 [Varicellaria rhodocarpa]|nr:hypothetical protein [Varicellaria rhodocarpa]